MKASSGSPSGRGFSFLWVLYQQPHRHPRMSAIALTREERACARLDGWATCTKPASFEARLRGLAPPAITAEPLRRDDDRLILNLRKIRHYALRTLQIPIQFSNSQTVIASASEAIHLAAQRKNGLL